MALGMNNSSKVEEIVEEGLGFVQYTRAVGRKRVLVSNCVEPFSPFRTPSKKRNDSRRINMEKSVLEALPQDILVQILCGVDHDDLKQLFHVSKSIREATLIAKQWHFAFSTPSSKTSGVSRIMTDFDEDASNFDSHEAPNAPKQERKAYRSRINRKKLADISVALFALPEEDRWSSRNRLWMETGI